MGKSPGFWKKTGIALRKIFVDPWRKGMSKQNSLKQNLLTFGRNLTGTVADVAGLAEFAMDALNLDALPLGGIAETGLEKIAGVSNLMAHEFNKALTGKWEKDSNLPMLDSIADQDWGEAINHGKNFIDEVNREYEERYGNGTSSFNQKPYGQTYDKANLYPGSRQQLTRPGARKELFNLQRPHWTTSQSRINKFGQK